MTSPPPYAYNTSGMLGRETGFRVPESFDEEFRRLNDDNNTQWRKLVIIEKGNRPWKNPEVIKDSIFPTYGVMDLQSLSNFFVVTDPKYPNWIRYPFSYREEKKRKQREREQRNMSYTLRQTGTLQEVPQILGKRSRI